MAFCSRTPLTSAVIVTPAPTALYALGQIAGTSQVNLGGAMRDAEPYLGDWTRRHHFVWCAERTSLAPDPFNFNDLVGESQLIDAAAHVSAAH